MTGKAPTVAEEMAKFSGFTTNNGETVPASKTTTAPGATDLSDEERAAGAKVVGGKEARATGAGAKPAAAPVKVELTDEEADAALEAARAKLGEGEELTPEEEDETLATALDAKKAAAKPNTDPNSRVQRAQAGRRRAEARAARAERELDDIKRRLAAIESGGGKAPLTGDTKAGKPAASASAEPQPKDFELGELDPKYIRALVRWENEQADAERSQNQQTTQQTAAQQRAAEEFNEKKAAFEDAGLELYDDFQETVMDTVGLPKSDPAAWPLSATLGKLILDSEAGPHVAYLLASDPKEARRVDKLDAAAQMRWFFQQEAKFSSDKGAQNAGGTQEQDDTAGRHVQIPQTRQVTKAPPPPQRNRGGSGNRTVSAATSDFAAFEAMANAAATPKR